jgi:RNA methyltransferase, TrmH family
MSGGAPSVGDGEVVRSPRNPRIQAVTALHEARTRRSEGLHLAEGRRVCVEAIAAAEVVELLHTSEHADLVATLPEGVRSTCVDDRVMARLSDAVTPQGVVAVVRTPDPRRPVPDRGAVLVLDRVGDPGNVGTLVRTAAALGAVVVSIGGADPFGPKSVRASAGACYRTAIHRRDGLGEAAGELRGAGRLLVGLAADGSRTVAEVAAELPVSGFVLVVGSEPSGIDPVGGSELDVMARIPMRGGVESLNVAAAGAIALHALLGP